MSKCGLVAQNDSADLGKKKFAIVSKNGLNEDTATPSQSNKIMLATHYIDITISAAFAEKEIATVFWNGLSCIEPIHSLGVLCFLMEQH